MTQEQFSRPIQSPPKWKRWILAARPKTLPAAAAPVVMGSFLAGWESAFKLLPAAAALMCALLLQIGSNLANDVFDFQRGADREGRLGPVRVTQTGLLAPGEVKVGMGIILAAAALCGLYLSWVSAWWLLVVGLLAILAAVGYSGGPIPFGYHGLGDVFVFIFFGIVAVSGTYFLQAGRFTLDVLTMSAVVGGLITNILVVNNLRDLESDREAGKITLAAAVGPEWTRLEYALFSGLAYAGPAWLILSRKIPPGAGVIFLALPWSVRLIRQVNLWEGSRLNRTLAETSLFALGYVLLFGLGGSLLF